MKEKIEGMIRDLLSKLPVIGPRFAQKNEDEDYEDGTTEVDISDGGEEDFSEDEDLEEEDEEDEDEALLAKKKKRTLYIRIFIGLLVAYLLVDMFILDSGDEQQGDNSAQVSQESAQAKKIEEMRKKRQEEKRLAKEAAEKQQAEAAPTSAPAPTEAPQPVAQADNTPTPAPAPAPAPAPVAQEAQAPKEIPEPTVATEESTTPDNAVDNMPSETETSTDATTTESPDQLVDQVANQVDEQPADETSEGTEEQLSNDAGQVSATEAPGEVKEESAPVVEPAPSVVEKAEKYVAAPDYEERGRGLVYNCVGKHWACVNRKAYFQCRKNERWQKQEGKALECHLDKTYASNEDCEKVQKYKVNMNTSTDFCQAGN